ncbi:MAG: bifunctional nuclease family protein [Spirochaetales bacterium]|nr:bifunctional nuclease family protein [Spirochaetales bacterium]
MRNTELVEVEVWTLAKTDRGNAVLLRPLEANRVVPIFIGQLEAQSILIGMGKVPIPRPLTHDLLLSSFDKLNVIIDRVEITDMQDGIYYAQIASRQGMKKFVFDSRPSDAISLAVRVGCPVYLAEFIIDETSIPEAMVSPAPEVSPEELEEALEDELSGDEQAGSPGDEMVDEELDTETSGSTDEADKPGNALQNMLARLEAKLDIAVSQENYEDAARIRDQIQEFLNLRGDEEKG